MGLLLSSSLVVRQSFRQSSDYRTTTISNPAVTMEHYKTEITNTVDTQIEPVDKRTEPVDTRTESVTWYLCVQESQRPTIEEMLQHPLIVPRLPATKSTGEARRSSATVSRDEGYSSRMESLRKSEELLVDRQRELRLKEKELESG